MTRAAAWRAGPCTTSGGPSLPRWPTSGLQPHHRRANFEPPKWAQARCCWRLQSLSLSERSPCCAGVMGRSHQRRGRGRRAQGHSVARLAPVANQRGHGQAGRVRAREETPGLGTLRRCARLRIGGGRSARVETEDAIVQPSKRNSRKQHGMTEGTSSAFLTSSIQEFVPEDARAGARKMQRKKTPQLSSSYRVHATGRMERKNMHLLKTH